MLITREIAQRCVEIIDQGLTSGLGVQQPGKFCVEAAICYALGLPHGDDPGCVSAPLRIIKIKLNDSRWSSDMARAAGLRRLAIAQLGSKGMLDDAEFVRRVVEMTIRKLVPTALRSAAKRNPKHASDLEAAAVRCEQEGTREAASDGERIARVAAAADVYTDAYDATAADCCACACTRTSAAGSADAAGYAADAAAGYTSSAAARDKSLAQYGEWVVEILIAMDAPGCQWLDVTPVVLS